MNEKTLHNENRQFQGTHGVSENCRATGFQPAFKDQDSGRIELSRQKSGEPATMHLISWLPREWAESTGQCGAVLTLKPGIVSGFVKDGVFYTRDEVTCLGPANSTIGNKNNEH